VLFAIYLVVFANAQSLRLLRSLGLRGSPGRAVCAEKAHQN
jgi:hypothetical protein